MDMELMCRTLTFALLICVVRCRSLLQLQNTETPTDLVTVSTTTEDDSVVVDAVTELVKLKNSEQIDTEVTNLDGTSNKRLPFVPIFLTPSQIFEPLHQKLSLISEYLTHPNLNLGLPRPSRIWEKIQTAGNHLFGTANGGGLFGLGQIGGQDYPIPYRLLDRKPKELLQLPLMRSEAISLPFGELPKFPLMLSEEEVRQFLRNITQLILRN
ncbi:PREDICTED: uncharacterized protein LOC108563222 [Nicrophorus vespilloides]|uniref:Uncharacterized protein LOC108563222 n=1 Tax=Nicrophorus vespilloides TaxID=110193 RepID=A0ABM1MRX5_NICVS|nr:PREDICTED: uncharacterized protein LOC108563222 [Nicrophorus vespilloides]